MAQSDQNEFTRWGLLGVIPLLVTVVSLWLSPWIIPQHIAIDFAWGALIYLGIVIGFLTGVSAGLDMHPQNPFRPFMPHALIIAVTVAALLPSGFLFFSLPFAWRFVVIIVVLFYILLRDLDASASARAPTWYGQLRTRLSFWVGLSATLIILRLFFWGMY